MSNKMNFDKFEQDIMLFWLMTCKNYLIEYKKNPCLKCPIKTQCKQVEQKLTNT